MSTATLRYGDQIVDDAGRRGKVVEVKGAGNYEGLAIRWNTGHIVPIANVPTARVERR